MTRYLPLYLCQSMSAFGPEAIGVFMLTKTLGLSALSLDKETLFPLSTRYTSVRRSSS